jgi:hypothetical protein
LFESVKYDAKKYPNNKHPSKYVLDYLYVDWVRKEELERWV